MPPLGSNGQTCFEETPLEKLRKYGHASGNTGDGYFFAKTGAGREAL
jgi:hypothetical protein